MAGTSTKQEINDLRDRLESLEGSVETGTGEVLREILDKVNEAIAAQDRIEALFRELTLPAGPAPAMSTEDVEAAIRTNPGQRFQVLADYGREPNRLKAGRVIQTNHYGAHMVIGFVRAGLKVAKAE